MSILDTSTNDFAINHLDLDATPGTPATDDITRGAINAANTTTPTPTPKRTGSKASMTSLRLAPWPVFKDSKTPGRVRARAPTLRHTRRSNRTPSRATFGREDRHPVFVRFWTQISQTSCRLFWQSRLMRLTILPCPHLPLVVHPVRHYHSHSPRST
jgi:hypothetical protein